MSDADVLERVAEVGAIVVTRQPVEATDVATWRRDLRRAARTRGMGLHIRSVEAGAFLVYNPDHTVDQARMRAAVEAVVLPEAERDP